MDFEAQIPAPAFTGHVTLAAGEQDIHLQGVALVCRTPAALLGGSAMICSGCTQLRPSRFHCGRKIRGIKPELLTCWWIQDNKKFTPHT